MVRRDLAVSQPQLWPHLSSISHNEKDCDEIATLPENLKLLKWLMQILHLLNIVFILLRLFQELILLVFWVNYCVCP